MKSKFRCLPCRESFATAEEKNRHDRTVHGKRGITRAAILPFALLVLASCNKEAPSPENTFKRPVANESPELVPSHAPTPGSVRAVPAHASGVARSSMFPEPIAVEVVQPTVLANPAMILLDSGRRRPARPMRPPEQPNSGIYRRVFHVGLFEMPSVVLADGDCIYQIGWTTEAPQDRWGLLVYVIPAGQCGTWLPRGATLIQTVTPEIRASTMYLGDHDAVVSRWAAVKAGTLAGPVAR